MMIAVGKVQRAAATAARITELILVGELNETVVLDNLLGDETTATKLDVIKVARVVMLEQLEAAAARVLLVEA